ncbi:MAG: hypothetical protein KIT11_05790 [Fimbriimonadaceae bacterium]|nr:hypothetical protein [Fimbriimonadaceae bacterium]QYK56595.1 MAG: hypothetical protein KF733_03725 [Fimbriimonadaceae bacterium]
MDRKFYVLDPAGPRRGPFTVEELKAEVEAGQAKEDDRVEDADDGLQMDLRDAIGPYAFQAAAKPAAKPASQSVALVAVVGGVVVVATVLLGAVLFPVFAAARIAAAQTQELTELFQLERGLSVYVADFDDRYPPRMESVSATFPYVKSYVQGMKEPPKTKNPDGGDILGNPELDSLAIAQISAPQLTMKFYDSMPWPNKLRCVTLADGSVRKVADTAVKGALSKKSRMFAPGDLPAPGEPATSD